MRKIVLLRASIPALFLALAATLPAGAAPTSAQQQAIRSACPDDFRAKCAGVSPGGADALACLQKNLADLSPACQSAVSAASPAPAAPATTPPPADADAPKTQGDAPPPAPKPAPSAAAEATPMPAMTPRQEALFVRQSCGRDFRTFCRGVPFGSGNAVACLKANAASLSSSCKQALNGLRR